MSKISKIDFIDAYRGWAILLVIICHSSNAVTSFHWRINSMFSLGWYGVQLFFIVSAFTLFRSYSYRSEKEKMPQLCFWIRRFFRIAPLFYIMVLGYILLRDQTTLYSVKQILITLFFINGFDPTAMGVGFGYRGIVPGQWSIATEFSFYFILPLLFPLIKKNNLFFWVSLSSIVIMYLLNSWALKHFSTLLPRAVEQYIYYWLPNQLPVFFLGIFIYKLWVTKNFSKIKFHWLIVPALSIGIAIFVTNFSQGQTLSNANVRIPDFIIVSLCITLIIIISSYQPNRFIVNKYINKLGKHSYSCYLLHFAFIEIAKNIVNMVPNETVVFSFYKFFFVLIFTIVTTFITSILTLKCIENPGIKLGEVIIDRIQFKKQKGKVLSTM
jgi:peptidoglycan/LPS O-acetylase OafA/YrhL